MLVSNNVVIVESIQPNNTYIQVTSVLLRGSDRKLATLGSRQLIAKIIEFSLSSQYLFS
jgi:hypothetical protein